MSTLSKHKRLEDANYLIWQISLFGRRFFFYEPENRIAQFELDFGGRVWFRDEYTNKRVYVAYNGRWRNFSNGGTLQALIYELGRYIRTGKQITPRFLGPWADRYCGGDLWGYGVETMAMLRNITKPRNCIAWPSEQEQAA